MKPVALEPSSSQIRKVTVQEIIDVASISWGHTVDITKWCTRNAEKGPVTLRYGRSGNNPVVKLECGMAVRKKHCQFPPRPTWQWLNDQDFAEWPRVLGMDGPYLIDLILEHSKPQPA